MTKVERTENLVLALWVGSMVGIGYIAAPVLFSALEERQMAGMLAGKMFHVIMIVGLVCGGFLLVSRFRDEAMNVFKHWRGWLLLLMLICVLGSMTVLHPMIADLKAQGSAEGSDAAKLFGQLHGISALIYVITVASGGALIFMGIRKPC